MVAKHLKAPQLQWKAAHAALRFVDPFGASFVAASSVSCCCFGVENLRSQMTAGNHGSSERL